LQDYTLTLTGKKDNLTVSVFTLQAVAEYVPVLSVIRPREVLKSSRPNTLSALVIINAPYTIEWRLVKGKPLSYLTPINLQALTIRQNFLIEGALYTFEVVLVSEGSPLHSYLEVQANTPPCCGTFNIVPSSGYELMAQYDFLATDWDDIEKNISLSYSIVQQVEGKQPTILSSSINTNKLQGRLARSRNELSIVEVGVYDSLDSSSSTTAT
jgi:hypothetical protein